MLAVIFQLLIQVSLGDVRMKRNSQIAAAGMGVPFTSKDLHAGIVCQYQYSASWQDWKVTN